ncbi:glycosyltransferase family 28 protein [Cooperia oncophora]
MLEMLTLFLQEWNNILNLKNTSVLVSFGSMAKSVLMPDQYKKTLLEVFQSMPDTTFIWKYEEEDSKLVAHLKNVHLSSWVPQKALLGKYLKLPINRHTGEITLSADPRLSVFVTHGGLGSTTELAHMGKPALLIPLFSDQTRNAHMLVRHGGGIVLNKNDLENAGKVTASLKSILSDASYAQNAKRLAAMLLNQPISAKQLFIRHSEFAGSPKMVFLVGRE